MASLRGFKFVAVYSDKDGQGKGREEKKTNSARSPQALVRWAERACPRGKQLDSIIVRASGSAVLWNRERGLDNKVCAYVFD